MPSCSAHYEEVLADVYAWMLGGFDAALQCNADFFAKHDVGRPRGSGRAVDLGAGCGFQAIVLARLGFSVTAIDLDPTLLQQLRQHAGSLPVRAVQGDLLAFGEHVDGDLEIAVCMTDTLLHLESRQDVTTLFARVREAMAPGGRFFLTFRDLTSELAGLDRFIPVRSDSETILTCFLEYEPDTVKVHDIVYRHVDGGWQCRKSYYRKLRLAPDWVRIELERSGFEAVRLSVAAGLATVIATS